MAAWEWSSRPPIFLGRSADLAQSCPVAGPKPDMPVTRANAAFGAG
jgi:hypothetical protein